MGGREPETAENKAKWVGKVGPREGRKINELVTVAFANWAKREYGCLCVCF